MGHRFALVAATALSCLPVAASAQSPYTADQIDLSRTTFTLHSDPVNFAGFGWGSQWTSRTVVQYGSKHVIFKWTFLNGTTGFMFNGNFLFDFPQTGYAGANAYTALEDLTRTEIQPLRRDNPPVRVELWLGESNQYTTYLPELLVDSACFNEQTIQYNIIYRFSRDACTPPPEPPVLFVHGFCSSSPTWDPMIAALKQAEPRRYSGMSRLYMRDDGSVRQVRMEGGTRTDAGVTSTVPASTRVFTIDFYNGGFDETLVAGASIQWKAHELKTVIQDIKRITGKPRVILVGHSLGGLAARTYVEGLAQPLSDYADDVARIVAIDTPHRGAYIAYLEAFGPCFADPSFNKDQLRPSSTFLSDLNSINLPADTDLVSVASWQLLWAPTQPWLLLFSKSFGDLVVFYDSQNLLSLSNYRVAPNRVRVVDNLLWQVNDPALHMSVHQAASTIEKVRQAIQEASTGAAVRAVRWHEFVPR